MSQPQEGLVFGAAFRGKGRMIVKVTDPRELQQLRLLTGQDEMLSMDFSEAAFLFGSDPMPAFANVKWAGGDPSLGDLLHKRIQERENVGAELVPRVFKSILSADRKHDDLLVAELKTSQKGWIQVRCAVPNRITASLKP